MDPARQPTKQPNRFGGGNGTYLYVVSSILGIGFLMMIFRMLFRNQKCNCCTPNTNVRNVAVIELPPDAVDAEVLSISNLNGSIPSSESQIKILKIDSNVLDFENPMYNIPFACLMASAYTEDQIQSVLFGIDQVIHPVLVPYSRLQEIHSNTEAFAHILRQQPYQQPDTTEILTAIDLRVEEQQTQQDGSVDVARRNTLATPSLDIVYSSRIQLNTDLPSLQNPSNNVASRRATRGMSIIDILPWTTHTNYAALSAETVVQEGVVMSDEEILSEEATTRYELQRTAALDSPHGGELV